MPLSVAAERAELLRFATECKERAKHVPPDALAKERAAEGVKVETFVESSAPLAPQQYRQG